MDIHVFKMNGDYSCTATMKIDMDFADICNKIVGDSLKDILIQCFPETNRDEIEIECDWIYNGYRVYIIGKKLSEQEIDKFIDALDPLKKIGLCNRYWDITRERDTYTGLLLAYDYTHYHKFMAGPHSFVVLTYGGLDEFLKNFNMKYNFISPEYEPYLRELKFEFSKDQEKEFTKDKLRGVEFKADVEIRVHGRMYTFKEDNLRGFSRYHQIKSGK